MNAREHARDYPLPGTVRELELTCKTSARILILKGGGMNITVSQPIPAGCKYQRRYDTVSLGTEDLAKINKAVEEIRADAEAIHAAIC